MNDAKVAAENYGVNLSRLPVHIGIIMDGNGRWATAKNLPRLVGHREGYKTLRSVVLFANELGIKFLTVYAFSAENWKRPQDEVDGLMDLITQAAIDELRIMHQNNVRVKVIGRMNDLPDKLQNALKNGIETTKNNNGITFTLAINYGGRAEIVDAVKRILKMSPPPDIISEKTISENLYSPELPEPDLLIRTAGEMRLSNFLLWQSAYSELVVLPTNWPDFSLNDLLEACKQYGERTRKFGAVIP